MFEKEKSVAIEAVREAAQLCQNVQRSISPGVLQKKDRSPVTVADFGSQALICRRLREVFPDDPIIAEEDAASLRSGEQSRLFDQVVARVGAVHPQATHEQVAAWIDYGEAASYSDRFWTLDPIDGTKGFLRGEQYAVALALIVEGQVAVAALACPNLQRRGGAAGAVFAAVRGEGAVEMGPAGAEAVPIRVSRQTDAAQARFCESVEAGHSSHDDAAAVARRLGIETEPVRLDSQAKYAVVARGEAEIYLRLPTRADYVEKIWDHAAGALVVSEAGGRVTDVHGRPLRFTHGHRLEENSGVVVTNGSFHDEVLEALVVVGVA